MISYNQGAVRPDLIVRNWVDESNNVIDCSGATAWRLRIGKRGEPALLSKTASITGASGVGGSAQITVQWQLTDLSFAAGLYKMQITMTKDSVPRIFEDDFLLKAAVE